MTRTLTARWRGRGQNVCPPSFPFVSSFLAAKKKKPKLLELIGAD